MPYQVVWGNCNVFTVEGDRQTLRRGEFLPGELDAQQVSQLATIGAIQYVDTALAPLPTIISSLANAPLPTSEPVSEQPQVEPAEDVVDVVVAPVSAGTETVVLGASGDTEPVEEPAPAAAAEAKPEPPKEYENKPAWVDYAVSQGLSKDEANAMSKQDLVDKFGA